jgi:hypothetical protein
MEMNHRGIVYNYNFLKRYVTVRLNFVERATSDCWSFKYAVRVWIRLSNEGRAANRTLGSLVKMAGDQARLQQEKQQAQEQQELPPTKTIMFFVLW